MSIPWMQTTQKTKTMNFLPLMNYSKAYKNKIFNFFLALDTSNNFFAPGRISIKLSKFCSVCISSCAPLELLSAKQVICENHLQNRWYHLARGMYSCLQTAKWTPNHYATAPRQKYRRKTQLGVEAASISNRR